MRQAVPLRRIARVLNGGTPSPDAVYWDGDVPWATPVDLAKVDGQTLRSTDRTLTNKGLATGSTLAPANAILLSTRAPIGYTATVAGPTAFNQGCKAVIPTGSIHTRFLQFCLVAGCRDLREAGQGSTFAELSNEALLGFAVPRLDLAEQRRVASFLDDRVARIDHILTARDRQLRLLTSVYESLIAQRMDALAAEHDLVPLRRFAARIEQGWSPVAESAPAHGDAPGVVKLGAVRDGDFIADENKALPFDVEPNELYRLRQGDLLITRANTPALVGDAAVVEIDSDTRLYLSDLIYRVRLSGADPYFVSAALRAPLVRQELATLARGTSRSMAKLRGEDVLGLAVPGARLSQQSRLGDEDRSLRRSLKRRWADLARFRERILEYKQSLITAAVSGEFDVTTASDRSVPAWA